MISEQDVQAARIAVLNDLFRRSGLRVVVTGGVQSVSDLTGLMREIKRYNRFSRNSDPYGEHDFGSLRWRGKKIFWKIDYYNQSLDGGEDPLSPDCKRVMTVMLAEEY